MKAPYLGGATKYQHFCRFAARFPGRNPPYTGQSSIFLGKYTSGRKKIYFLVFSSESKGEKKKTHIKIFAKYLDLFCISINIHYICSAIRYEFIDKKE